MKEVTKYLKKAVDKLNRRDSQSDKEFRLRTRDPRAEFVDIYWLCPI